MAEVVAVGLPVVEQVDPIYSLLKSAAGLPSQRTAARQVTDSTADSQPMSSANAAVTISADIGDKGPLIFNYCTHANTGTHTHTHAHTHSRTRTHSLTKTSIYM